jgi:hypothetical protein
LIVGHTVLSFCNFPSYFIRQEPKLKYSKAALKEKLLITPVFKRTAIIWHRTASLGYRSRLLYKCVSYDPMVEVLGPKGMREQVRQRVQRQMERLAMPL